jgi:NAD(P)-dependent dehydrogenase (short-subunit alcohol dehydrogenase family)
MARVVLVTGSTDGIGRQTARMLAAGGMTVIVHGRSKQKVDHTAATLRSELPGATIESVAFDLGTLAGVRRGAEAILAIAPELHVLVNNAGIFATERSVTIDQLELTLAVNHVGPFLLTQLLMPRLLASATSAPSRVINVSSVAHTRGKIADDLQMVSNWSGYGAYAQSKLANVMHAMSLAEKHDPAQLVAYALHPGVIATKLLKTGFGPVQGASVESGAKSIVRLAAEETVTSRSGSYFSEGVETPPAASAKDKNVRDRLWLSSIRMAKLPESE